MWAAPTSALGGAIALACLATGARARRVEGALEVHGGILATGFSRLTGFGAFALGHVLVGCSPETLERLRKHEHVHVRQAERWGFLFVPAYLLASLWQWLRGRDPYLDNPFEREAREADRDCPSR